MEKPRKARALAPTSAVDMALEALAAGDAERALRWAVPALADHGSGAVAADLVGRALSTLGEATSAVEAFERAVAWLCHDGMVTHAVASALAHRELSGSDAMILQVARAFGADSPLAGPVAPPSLHSDNVESLPGSLTGRALILKTAGAIATMAEPPTLPAYPLPRLSLWHTLPVDAFHRFATSLAVSLVPPGTVLMEQGTTGYSAFLVARGDVRVTRTDSDSGTATEVAVIGAGGIVGEIALVTDAPRVATVTAARACLVLEAGRATLETAAAATPALSDLIAGFCRSRLIENVLRTAPVLRALGPAERDALAARFETRAYEPGQLLVEQGAASTGLHVIASGLVDVLGESDGNEPFRIASLGPGHCLGEISLVLRRPATASAVAVDPTISFVLPADGFMAVVRSQPALLSRLYDMAVQRDDETRLLLAQEAVEMEDVLT